MASNVKWYKRALRTLSNGDEKLWNVIKNKLPQDRIDFLENKFSGKSKKAQKETITETKPAENQSPAAPIPAIPPGQVKTPRKKSRKKAVKANPKEK